MSSSRLIYLLSILAILIIPLSYASDIYVSKQGSNSASCGAVGSPCLTIEHAVEKRAVSGDVIKVNDGTYTENQITFPLGVSLTAVNKNYPNPTVKIEAAASFLALLDLRSTPPVKDGAMRYHIST